MSGYPTRVDLWRITAQVWASYVDPDSVRPLLPDRGSAADATGVADVADAAGVAWVSAAVAVTGAWDGDVVVTCAEPAARHITAALLGVELPDVTPDDMTDAVGELVNIIGGNLKGWLPEPCALSLPRVVPGAGSGNPGPSILVCRLSCTWLGESIVVSVLEHSGQSVGVPAP